MKIRSSLCSSAHLGLAILALCGSAALGDSLWTDEPRLSLVSDKKAFAVGDIITVIVQESNSATKESNTKTSKASDLDASINSFLFSPAASRFMTHNKGLPAMKLKSKNDFDGGGSINNSESIVARFGVRVVDVLPNGNMIVEGARQTSVSQESQTVILRGVVRPYDISANNTVFSYNLADVSIKMSGSGAVSSTQKKGWFSRAWDVLTPF